VTPPLAAAAAVGNDPPSMPAAKAGAKAAEGRRGACGGSSFELEERSKAKWRSVIRRLALTCFEKVRINHTTHAQTHKKKGM